MSTDKITEQKPQAIDLDSLALSTARKIAAVDPTKGAIQALEAIQREVKAALEVYGTPSEQDLMRRSLSDVVDPNDWAEAFCKFVPGAVLGKVDQGVLASWFGDAIMKGFDIASQRSIKRLTMIYECERIIGDPEANDAMKRRASLTKDALLDRKDHGLALVDRRELEEANAKLDRAVRALQRSGFQDLGGEEWQPPVNEVAGKLQQRVYELEHDLASAEKGRESAAKLMMMYRDWAEKSGNGENSNTTTWPARAVRMTFMHPTIGDERLTPLLVNTLHMVATEMQQRDEQGSQMNGPVAYDSGITVMIEDFAMLDPEPAKIPEIELTPEQRAELSTASSNLEGVDIDAAHRDKGRVIILHPDPALQWAQDLCDFKRTEMLKAVPPEASALVTAHLKTAGLIAVDMAQGPDTGIQFTYEAGKGLTSYEVTSGPGSMSQGMRELITNGTPLLVVVDNSVDSVDNAQKGEQVQEDQKGQSQDEGKAEEPVMQEKQESKGVFIPGAKWPVPGERRFSLDRRDPMNPANRSDPIERSAKDRRKTGKRDS